MILQSMLLLLAALQDPATSVPVTPEPTAPVPATPEPVDNATCVQDPNVCVKAAGAEFDAGHFAEAVRLFEALVAAYPNAPKYHYFAGLARESAGDDTAAYLHMRRFLASNTASQTERKHATRRTAAILARTTKVSLRTPTHTDPLTLRLTRTGATHPNEPPIVIPLAALTITAGTHELALTPGEWELALDPDRLGDMEVVPRRIEALDGMRTMMIEITTRPVRHELTLELGPARALKRGVTLYLHRINGPTLSLKTRVPGVHRELPPGTWVYEVQARGFLPQTQTIELNGPQSLTLELAPKWNDDRRKRLKLGIGLAGAGLVTGITGAALLYISESGMPDPVPGELYGTNFNKIRALRPPGDLGSAAVGLTAGLWTSALTSSLTKRWKNSWKTNLALGLLATAGSMIAYGLINQRWNELDSSNQLNPIGRRYQPMLASGGMGLGLGLISGAVATFVQHRPQRARSSALLRHNSGPKHP